MHRDGPAAFGSFLGEVAAVERAQPVPVVRRIAPGRTTARVTLAPGGEVTLPIVADRHSISGMLREVGAEVAAPAEGATPPIPADLGPDAVWVELLENLGLHHAGLDVRGEWVRLTTIERQGDVARMTALWKGLEHTEVLDLSTCDFPADVVYDIRHAVVSRV